MNELYAVVRVIESVQATGKPAALTTVVSVSGSEVPMNSALLG